MRVRERASESAQMQITGGGTKWICRFRLFVGGQLSKRLSAATVHWDWLLVEVSRWFPPELFGAASTASM